MRMLLSSGGAPALAMFSNPIEQGPFETDIVTETFGFQPLVFQDLFSFGEKFLIQAGLFHELAGRRRLLSWMSHEARNKMRARRRSLSMPAIHPAHHIFA